MVPELGRSRASKGEENGPADSCHSRMGQESDTRSAQAWRLAAKQHGIVTRRQLLGLGYSPRSVEHRIARGRLFPVSLGIYAVGWPALTQKRRWMAAVLAGGEGAALSHRSAAVLW